MKIIKTICGVCVSLSVIMMIVIASERSYLPYKPLHVQNDFHGLPSMAMQEFVDTSPSYKIAAHTHDQTKLDQTAFSDVTSNESFDSTESNLSLISQQTIPTSRVSYKSASTAQLFNGLVKRDNVHGSQLMLQKGLASIDLSNKLEENMLHVAARDNSYNIINFLIKKNRLDIDQKNLKGQTPLCLAAKYRHYDVIKELVELGANLNVQDPMGRTALHWACDDEGIVSKSRTRDGDKIVKFLLAVDRSIPAENKKNKVLSFDDQDPYTYTNLDIKDNDGRVPLHLAVMSKRYVTLQELSDTGALLDIQDNDGNTPLHLAALQGDVSAVDILLKGGADIDVINYEHKMPLQCVTVPKVAALFVKYK